MTVLPPAADPVPGSPDLADGPFLRACRRQPVAHTPVWFMRQAGRSLPEYRRARGTGSILGAIAQPDLAAELTLQPVRRYGVDAAIVFSDIVVPVHAIGFGVDVEPGRGPVIERPFRRPDDLERLRPLEPDTDVPYVLETVRLVRAELESTGVPADRLRRGPVHRGQLPGRGGPVADLRQGEGPDARRARAVDRPARPVGRHGRRLPPGPGGGGGLGPPALRQLGRLAEPGRVRALRPAQHPGPVGRAGRSRRADHLVRGGHGRAAGPHGHGRGRRHRDRLAGPAVGGPSARRPGSRGAGQPRPGGVPGPVPGGGRGHPRPCWPKPGRPPVTSSTWATACCPRPTPGVLAAVVELVHAEGRAGVLGPPAAAGR